MLVSQEVEKLGLGATDEEVIFHLTQNPPPFLRSNPSFQTDGNFDQDKYNTAINSPEGDEWVPIENFMKTSFIPNFKLQQYLNQSIIVDENDVMNEFRKRTIDYTISAIHVTSKSLKKDESEPTNEELFVEYNKDKSKFNHDELRNIKYVTWQKKPSKTDSLNLYKLATDVFNQVKSGESFSSLAKEYSQDPGSQPKGGDLGWFGKGKMVKPFEEAAFNAKKGAIVGPIKSRLGLHIIEIRDRKVEKDEEQILASHVLFRFETSLTTLSDIKREATLFLYDAQDSGFVNSAQNLKINDLSKVKSTDKRLPYVGQIRGAIRSSFEIKSKENTEVFENDNYFTVLFVDSVIAPGIISFEDAKKQLRPKVKLEKEKVMIEEEANNLLVEIASDNYSFKNIFEKNRNIEKLETETKNLSEGFTSIGRSNFLNGSIVKSEIGSVVGPIETNRGWVIYKLLEKSNFDSTEYQVQKDLLKATITSRKQNQIFKSWLDNLKSEAEIVDNRKYYF